MLPNRTIKTLALAVLSTLLVADLAQPAGAAGRLNRSTPPETIVKAGERLRRNLGAAFGGYWLDALTGEMVVGVTNPGLGGLVTAEGATPRYVARNEEALERAKRILDDQTMANGKPTTIPASVASWGVDLPSNSVVVSVVDKDAAALAFASAAGDAVRFEEVPEAPQPLWNIVDGQAMYGGTSRCSVGFNARNSSGARFVLTAGHCTNISSEWSGVGGGIGSRAGSSFPSNDYGAVRVTSTIAASTAQVSRYSAGSPVTVAGVVTTPVGGNVCRSGSTTGWRCGRVQAFNQTVSYPQGVVYGLTRTTACAEPGDSGGAVVSDPGAGSRVQAQGLVSGGSGNCTSGGTTFFQPLNEVVVAYGVTLFTG